MRPQSRSANSQKYGGHQRADNRNEEKNAADARANDEPRAAEAALAAEPASGIAERQFAAACCPNARRVVGKSSQYRNLQQRRPIFNGSFVKQAASIKNISRPTPTMRIFSMLKQLLTAFVSLLAVLMSAHICTELFGARP